MAKGKFFVTTEEMDAVVRGWGDLYGLPPGAMAADVFAEYGKKVDAPVLRGTAGAFQAVAGPMLFAGVSLQHNTWGVLPKVRHDKSAYRYITVRGKASATGLADAVATPDTLKPTVKKPEFTMKLAAVHTDMGALMQDLSTKNDDALRWAELMDWMAEEFLFATNADLAISNDVPPGNNVEQLERLISSFSEGYGASKSDQHATAAYAAGDLDPWGSAELDRDAAASGADAYVNHGGNGTTEVDRDFTGAPLLNTMFQNCAPHWDSWDNKVFLSRYDLIEALSEIEGAASRYVTQVFVRAGVNGIQTNPGQGTGFAASAYRGVPWIGDDALPADTLSIALLVDLDYAFIDILRPPTFLDSGENTNYVLLQKYAREAANYMECETVATRFPVHAKLRGLK